MIDRDSPIPLYYQLKQHFKRQIERGDLCAGDRLPTEMELCELFEISRAPVRQALTEMAREGLIYRRAGQGSFVAPAVARQLAKKTKLRVLAHFDVRWMGSLEQAVLDWNDLHPRREVELDVKMCGRQDFHRMLRRLAIQGEAPDIAPMDYVWIAHYASEGYIAPLDSLDSAWDAALRRELEPPVLANNLFGDRLYGVPVQADVTGFWYRKDWFEAEGLAPPDTWAEWLVLFDRLISDDLRARYGYQYPLVLPVTSATGEATTNLLIAFIWMSGGSIVNADGALTLDQDADAICNAMRFLQKITLDRRAYLPSSMYRTNWWDLARYFALGQVPMALGGSYEWPRIREESHWDDEADAARDLGFRLMPRPAADVPLVGSLGGTSWGIFRQSSRQGLCAEILRLMTTSEVSTEFCKENLQISPYVSTNRHLASVEHPWLHQIVPLLKYARHRPRIAGYIQLSNLLQDMFERILWEGEDPAAVVRQTSQVLSMVSPESAA
ncbi:MAG: extracellular solute-binding protein [Anaerolineae bacterium]|nr:extracellular solute-binding protein [Anaerolineae bacterium]